MATTEVFYDGDNSDVTFTIPFEYLEESDVKVSVGGTLQTQDTDYTFSTLTEITFTTAPASGTDNVRIFRDTDIESLRNEFFAGSAIRAQDLNDNYLQTLYSAQELEDQFVTKTDGEFDTNVDMNSNRITELLILLTHRMLLLNSTLRITTLMMALKPLPVVRLGQAMILLLLLLKLSITVLILRLTLLLRMIF